MISFPSKYSLPGLQMATCTVSSQGRKRLNKISSDSSYKGTNSIKLSYSLKTASLITSQLGFNIWILEEHSSVPSRKASQILIHIFFLTFQTIQHQTEEELMNSCIRECPKCSSWLGKILVKSHVMFNVAEATFSKEQKEINTRIPVIHSDLWWIEKPSTFSIKIALPKKVLCTCH